MPSQPTSPVPSYLLMCTIILIRLGVSIAFSVVHYCAVYGSSCSSTSCSTLHPLQTQQLPFQSHLSERIPHVRKPEAFVDGETQRRAGWRSGGPQVP
ncbi:unnamed protein product [Tilletia caries]|nr:unnamed protein product [Tilletia caries]